MNRKSTFTKVIAVFAMTTLSFFSFGQILLSEGFEGETFPPTGWTTIDNNSQPIDNWDTLDIADYSQGTFNPVTGTYVAASRSWVGPGAGTPYTPDNWLITPQLSITDANTTLRFNALGTWGTPSQGNGDFLEVYVSTLGTSIADFQSIFSQAFSSQTWEEVNLSLGAYNGQSIYIAFRHHNCSNEELIALDDIKVASPYNDLELTNMTNMKGGYTSIPSTQAHDLTISASITNKGFLDVTDYTLTSLIFLDPDYTAPVQTLTANGTNLAMGASATLNAGSYTPTVEGLYVVVNFVTVANDLITSNDTIVDFMTISANEYARDNADFEGGALGRALGTEAVIGHTFEITSPVRMDSVLFFLTPTAMGGNVSVQISNVVAGLPETTYIGKSADIAIDQAIMDAVTADGLAMFTPAVTDMNGNVLVLNPGTYFVGVKQDVGVSFMGLWHASSVSTPGTFFANANGGAYADLTATYPITPILRAYVTDPNSIVIISNDADNTICNTQTITLTSSAAAGNQWNLNGAPISGQTGASLIVNASGSYTATVGANTSNAIVATVVDCSALNENEIAGLVVYPNPTSGILTISAADFNGYNSITVKDQIGRTVVNATKINSDVMTFDLSKLAIGSYFVELTGNGSAQTIKVQVAK